MRTRSSPLRSLRTSATSGTVSDAGEKPCQCGEEPPSGANAKPPTASGPAPAGSSAGSDTAARRQRAPAVGHGGEALCAGGLQARRLTQRRQRRLAPVGLLEHEPALPLPARGADDGRRVHVGGERQRDRRQHLPAAAPRAPDRQRQPRGQALAILCVETESVVAGGGEAG